MRTTRRVGHSFLSLPFRGGAASEARGVGGLLSTGIGPHPAGYAGHPPRRRGGIKRNGASQACHRVSTMPASGGHESHTVSFAEYAPCPRAPVLATATFMSERSARLTL